MDTRASSLQGGSPRASFVVIGLNEAEHLAESIASCLHQGLGRDEIQIIYVDSGSTDGSIEIAEKAGADRILQLGTDGRNAARARNLGLAEVETEFVQFVDGDTQLAAGWLEDAIAALEADPRLAGAEGDLHEAHPSANLYHRVCELDWPSSPGQVAFASGNSVYRVAAIKEVGGFDPRMHVGEEPELGARLREKGWRFLHVDRVMGHHDLDMKGFGDWLRRGYKSGLACAMVVRSTGGWRSGFWRERLRESLAQSAVLLAPWLIALFALPFSTRLSLAACALGCALICALVARKALSMSDRGLPLSTRVAFGLHTYLCKIPASWGMLTAYFRRLPVPLADA
jgi:glycosyltransferase involved in cell wall biosynthesis